MFVVIVLINALLMYAWGHWQGIADAGEDFSEVRGRSRLRQYDQDLFCVVDEQGYVIFTSVEAYLAVRSDLGQVVSRWTPSSGYPGSVSPSSC